jgi:hypothetical protein
MELHDGDLYAATDRVPSCPVHAANIRRLQVEPDLDISGYNTKTLQKEVNNQGQLIPLTIR